MRWSLTVTGGLALVLVALTACRPTPPPPSGGGTTTKPSPPPPLLEDWEQPAAVFVFSGDQHGHLEPCGCSERQSGGMGRRADLLRQLREERNWPVAAFDVGGTLSQQRVSYPQSRIKFDSILSGLDTLDYAGLALGEEELTLGATNLYTAYLEASAAEDYDMPFLAANVTLLSTKEIGTPTEYRIIEVGDVRIGVTAVVGDSTRDALKQTGVARDPSELEVVSPDDVLPAMIEKMQEESPDLLVLLSHAEMEESRGIAERYPQFDVVVTTNSAEDPKREPEFIGETLFVKTGRKGKNAAVVGYFPESSERFQSDVVELDMDRFENAPSMIELMRTYQAKLEEAWPELSQDSVSDPQGRKFAGAEACKDCHTFAYGVWSKSRHAHAYESLIKGRPGQEANWISRIYDPECLCCHTTGWDPQEALRYESGFIDMEQTPHLAGQQCENCHGPAAAHAEFEWVVRDGGEITDEVTSAREALRLTLTAAKERVCTRCHDLDNSPKFDFDTYWPKVNHSGRKN